MRRRTLLALSAFGLFAFGLLLSAGPSWSFSDGIAGSSGAIEARFRTCQGTQYCKVKPSYCGGCHGSFDDMWHQEDARSTPQENVNALTFSVNGDGDAGTGSGNWQYNPGWQYTIDIRLADKRPMGRYNSGSFDLNASAGRLDKASESDDTVRITGGVYKHAGTKNPDIPAPQGQRYGSVESDETAWAGEATNTAKGAERRAWRVVWTAPPPGEHPRGVAFVMTAMLPNGDGVDNCTYRECNSTLGYAPQSEWDWFGFMIPRRILCEAGAYPNFAACQDAVLKFILPPAPPPATSCAPGDVDCRTDATDGRGGGAPGLEVATAMAAAGWAVWVGRRRRR